MGKLAVIMLLVVLLAGFFYTSPSIDVSAQESLTSTRITKDWGYEYTALTGDKIEVGDKTTTEFKPVLKLNRWDGEAYIEISLPTTEKISPTTTTEKVVWEGQTVDAHFYPLEPTEQYELGGFEYEIILKEKPLSNSLYFNIDFSPDVEFFYQSPLTQEEINEGDYRPDNVVGSYAVYSNDKRNHVTGQTNYMTGKIGHFYRPKATDSKGWEVWGELNIDPVAKTMTVTLPQEFIDKAVYPIRHAAGDTFGYTTHGSSFSSYSTYNELQTFPFAMGAADGTATHLTAYFAKAAANLMSLVIYDNASPAARIDYGSEDSSDRAVDEYEYAVQVGASLTANATYRLGYCFSSGGNLFRPYWDDGSPTHHEYQDISYSYPPPASYSPTASSAYRKYTVWCTYTLAAPPPPPPPPPGIPSEILPEGIPAPIGIGHLAWFIPLVLFSVPAFWKRNALLFMLAAACSLMMGFYWYVIFTTNLGLSLGIVLVGFGLVCLVFAIGCLFKRRRAREE